MPGKKPLRTPRSPRRRAASSLRFWRLSRWHRAARRRCRCPPPRVARRGDRCGRPPRDPRRRRAGRRRPSRRSWSARPHHASAYLRYPARRPPRPPLVRLNSGEARVRSLRGGRFRQVPARRRDDSGGVAWRKHRAMRLRLSPLLCRRQRHRAQSIQMRRRLRQVDLRNDRADAIVEILDGDFQRRQRPRPVAVRGEPRLHAFA